ncbi:hypothetical protein [Arenimonas sp. MALMAid1274]|uniref:hypothetical protein n=1 Tax=Arenimonas sp. MALMAid1274 TaxID=3411630 RepID=UPI003BA31490
MKSLKTQSGTTLFEVSLGCAVALLLGGGLLTMGSAATDQAAGLTAAGPAAVAAMEANHQAKPLELCRIETQATGKKPTGCP